MGALASARAIHDKFSEEKRTTCDFNTWCANNDEALRQAFQSTIKTLYRDKPATATQLESAKSYIRNFLERGGSIFTLNYDLLAYKILLATVFHGGWGFLGGDGFRSSTEGLVWCGDGGLYIPQKLFFLHGALHLRVTNDNGKQNVTKIKLNLESNSTDEEHTALIVTAGNSESKLETIHQNPYLAHGLKSLSKISGSLFTHGFSFHEVDSHIIEAILEAAKSDFLSLNALFIGTHSKHDLRRAEDIYELVNERGLGEKLAVYSYNTRSEDIWENAGIS